MASVLFSAIGRGYSARTILSSLARQSPKYANAINNAYYYGYAANSILANIASRKDKKNYDPDMFLTDFEKTQRRDQNRKKQQLLGSLAAAGTLAAAGAGIYALVQRNKPIHPEVLPALGKAKGEKGSKEPYTINRERPLLTNQQKQITNQQKQIANANPQQANQTQQRALPFYPPHQQASQNAPPIQPQTPQSPLPSQQPMYNTKNVDLVNNLKEDSRFRNIIEYGLDKDATEFALRSTLPKNVISLFDKSEGGLSQVIKDYSSYMKENPFKNAVEKNTEELIKQREQREQSQLKPQEASEQVANVELPTAQKPMPAQQAQPQTPIEQPQAQLQQPKQAIAPVEQPQIQKPSAPVKPLVSLKNGQMGTLEGIEKGVASINVDGNIIKEKASQLNLEGPEVEEAARQLVNLIPEGMKSTALMSMVYIPEFELVVEKFWDGKSAWYQGVSESDYEQIALGTYAPKGEGKTGIAEYDPSVADSRGAGNSQIIIKNPRFGKENKGKTWGYAKNEYDLLHGMQKYLHKFSKEKYDKYGKLIQPQKKVKKK